MDIPHEHIWNDFWKDVQLLRLHGEKRRPLYTNGHPDCGGSSSTSLTFQSQVVVLLDVEISKVFQPGQGSLQRTVQQIVDIPVPSGAQDFLPKQGSTVFCRDAVPGCVLQVSIPAHGSTACAVAFMSSMRQGVSAFDELSRGREVSTPRKPATN